MDTPSNSQSHHEQALQDLSSAITRVFETVLDRHPIRPDEDFFELGGSSILVISLLMALEERLGHEVPMALIYNAPTAAGLAALLMADRRHPSCLIPLRSGRTGRNLFIVHGIGGTTFELRSMAQEIEVDVAVFGLEAAGIDGSPPQERVEDMAALYVDKILKIQQAGPFLLAGYSFGGLIAFEMGRRLLQLGQEVGFLGLIDAYPDEGFSFRNLYTNMRQITRTKPEERLAELGKLWDKFMFRLRIRVGSSTPTSIGKRANLQDALARVRQASNGARQRYRPTAAPLEAIFFQAHSPLDVFPPDPFVIWSKLLHRLTVEKVMGDHYSLLTPGTRTLPLALGRHLRAAMS